MAIYDNLRSRSFTDLCARSLRFNIFKLIFLKRTLGRMKQNFIWSLYQGCWDENLFKYYGSHDQDGFQVHIKKLFLQNQASDDLETWYTAVQHQVLKYYQICSNDDTVLTLAIFMTRSKLFPNASASEKTYTAYSHVFSSLL